MTQNIGTRLEQDQICTHLQLKYPKSVSFKIHSLEPRAALAFKYFWTLLDLLANNSNSNPAMVATEPVGVGGGTLTKNSSVSLNYNVAVAVSRSRCQHALG